MDEESAIIERDTEIPRFIFYAGIISIVSLIIAFFMTIAVMIINPETHDTLIHNHGDSNNSTAARITDISYIFFSIGLIGGLFIIYGHVIKQKRDPQIVWGPKNMVHLPHIDTTKIIEEERSHVDLKQDYGFNPAKKIQTQSLNMNVL